MNKIFSWKKRNQIIAKPVDKTSDDYIPSNLEVYQFYFKFLKIKWENIIFLNIYWIISSFIMAWSPFIILDISAALDKQDHQQISSLVIQMIIIEFSSILLHHLERKMNHNLYQETQQSVQQQIIKHIFGLNMQYFQDHKISTISSIVKSGGASITFQLQGGQITGKINSFFRNGGIIYFIFKQSTSLLITLFIFSLAIASILCIMEIKQSKTEKKQDKQEEYQQFAIDDILSNIAIIKSFGTQKKELKFMNSIIQKNSEFCSKNADINSTRNMIENSTYQFLKVIVIFQASCGFLGMTEDRTNLTKSFIQIISQTFSIFHLSKDLLNFFVKTKADHFTYHFSQIWKVMKLFEEKQQFSDESESETTNELLEGNISFDQVFFSYPESKDALAKYNQEQTSRSKEKQYSVNNQSVNSSQDNEHLTSTEDGALTKQKEYILKNVSFNIKKGQFVSFVGKSGSGKSTLVKLLERFYEPNLGNILFDDKNIKDIPISQIIKSIGIVQQEPSLFDNDIEYNITYGCLEDNYTQEDLIKICDVSGVSEFVFDEKRFPDGLKTLVGTRGVKLSGGQKQRIAIARALIKKPKILILDEATSSLDSESEYIVQKYIDQLVGFRGMTIIVIAHRLSTVINSDKIFVMKSGEIKETGTHQELLAMKGIYNKLVHHQVNQKQSTDEVLLE